MQRTEVSRLESLPSELFLAIADFVGFEGCLSLSAANSKCRSALFPVVFRTLKITSDEEQANGVLGLAKKVGGNVQTISFYGTSGPGPNDGYEDEGGNEEANEGENGGENDGEKKHGKEHGDESNLRNYLLPQAAVALLSGEHLPNATRLVVNFTFDYDLEDSTWDSRDDIGDGNYMYVFSVSETSRAIAADSEAEYTWRWLMADTWTAASHNTRITSLVISALVPKPVTPWFGPQWARFLAQIKEVDMTVWGCDNHAGWEIGSLPGYMYFLSQLDAYFFAHMTSATKLRLSCYEHGPLGSRWPDDADTMALRPGCLPKLEELRLEYAIVCSELVDFLAAKRETLKHVALHECFSERNENGDEGNVLTWAAFFAGLCKSKPQYQSFTVTNNAPPPLTFKEWQYANHKDDESYWGKDGMPSGDEVDEDETDEIRRVKTELARDQGKRLFLYAMITSKYADRWPDHNAILQHYQMGKDLEEFEKLMRMIGERGQA